MLDAQNDVVINDDAIKDVVNRLRESRDEADEREWYSGSAYGEAWASDFAEWYELESLMTETNELLDEGDRRIEDYLGTHFDDLHRYRTEWGMLVVSASFKRGFLQGAEQVYQEVFPLMDD